MRGKNNQSKAVVERESSEENAALALVALSSSAPAAGWVLNVAVFGEGDRVSLPHHFELPRHTKAPKTLAANNVP